MISINGYNVYLSAVHPFNTSQGYCFLWANESVEESQLHSYYVDRFANLLYVLRGSQGQY
jgi:hypothetical protein